MFTKNEVRLIDFVKHTKFLQENTKDIYIRRYEVIKNDIYNKPIDYVIKYPKQFLSKLNSYAKQTKGRVGNECLSLHAKDGYISAMKALFIYNQELKEKEKDLLDKWDEIHDIIRKPIDKKYKSNKPTPRQEEGYISYNDILKKRNELEDGSIEKLLITMYTEIPPVRSDFYKTQIVYIDSIEDEKATKEKITQDINYIIINKEDITKSKLIMQKYKTSKHYKCIEIPLNDEILKQLTISLEKSPRNYLFVGKNKKPFDKENSFNTFANRLIKQKLENDKITLCMFRHSYISRPDLKLEEKSGLEQDEIAKVMGHSITQQAKYRWNIWLNEKKKHNK